MEWTVQDLGAVGEFVSAIAVVVTLAYLAVQIRQNTKASTSATRQAISDTIMSPATNFVQNAEFRRAFNAHVNGEEIDDDQRLQLEAYCYVNYRMWENIHYQYRSGMLSDSEWGAFRRNLKSFAQVPVMQDNWRREAYVYTDEFNELMETIFSELSSEPRAVPESLIHPANDRAE